MFSLAASIAGGTCPCYFAPPVDAGMVGCGSQSEWILQCHQRSTGPHRNCAKTELALSFHSQRGLLGSDSPRGRKVEGELSRQWGGAFLVHSKVTHGVGHEQPVYTAAGLAPSPGCTQKHLEYTFPASLSLRSPLFSGGFHSSHEQSRT